MLAGQGLRSAFERLCFQLLDYRYPLHPDFDPNGRGHDLRSAELDTVVAVVDKAAQDKVGRYEVPRGDVATLKKIANPLKLGVMHEQAFVLGHAWPELLNKKSAGAPKVSVGQLRGWIEEEQPGLPVGVQNLVVVCYSIQTDKEWLRGGQPIPMPTVARVTDDMALRGTELPTEAEFETASRRAEGIFGISREPVRTTRSVQALAAQLRRNASGLGPAAESLAGELARHAKTLGLDGAEQPRARTARLIVPLLARLAATADPTQAVRVLAEVELPRENAIYQAHLTSAELLTRVLRDRNWQVLDDLATRAGSGNDPQADAIITALRRAAGRDEHETSLGDPLRKADWEALELMMARTRTGFGSRCRCSADQRGSASGPPFCRRLVIGPDHGRIEPARIDTGRIPSPATHPRPGRRGRGGEDSRGGRGEPGRGVRDHLADRDPLMEPVANSSVVEGELRRALNSSRTVPGNSVLLLRAAPEWRGDATFTMEVDAGPVTVTVAKCRTVLAVLDAIGTSRDDGGYLVVLTPCETREVGESVLARAMQPEIKPINRWDLVQYAFGARRLDPALTRSENRWVAEALLDAQPAGGWRRLAGPVLTRATALNRLAATRLGIRDADDSAVDAAALLEWTTDASAVASFLQLREAERVGLVDWLAQSVGPVADVVFAMAAPGKVPDAVPFGLAIAALYEGADEPDAQPPGDALVARVRATERYLGGRSLDVRVLQAFGVAAESLVVRWTDNGHAPQAAALCERAESILSQLADGQPGNLGLVGSSRVLEAGLDARLAAFAGALADALGDTASAPRAATLARVQDALRLVGEHARKRDRGDEISAAQAAVRLARWLAAPDEPMATLHDAATSMLRSWAWADRALTAISRADTSRVPRLAEAYANLWDRARARRARLDQAFARKLATWTEGSSATDGLLLVENLMDRIARPLAPQRPPVVVVLDGMTAAIGCELAEELTGRGGWLEAGRRPDGREPALATIPSVTSISRTSLLTGELKVGGQAEERAGFAAFWGRRKSRLFHKADLTPGPGQALAAEVRDAIADPETVVGVVLNVIDDTLDKSKPGGPAHWTVETVTYLRPVLDEARRGGRPVVLTADHGHVLEWGHSLDGGQPASSARSDSARYRIGEPGAGEIVIRGPRVLTAGASRSSQRSTRRSATRRGRRATTAGRPRPRSSSRPSPCSPPNPCSRQAGSPTTPPGTPRPGGTRPRRPVIPRTSATAQSTRAGRCSPQRRVTAEQSADHRPRRQRRAVRRRRGGGPGPGSVACSRARCHAIVPHGRCHVARRASRRLAPDGGAAAVPPPRSRRRQHRRADRRSGTGGRPPDDHRGGQHRGGVSRPHVRLPGAGHPATQR